VGHGAFDGSFRSAGPKSSLDNKTIPSGVGFLILPNLQEWSVASVLGEELEEPPGLLELMELGNRQNSRWVLWGAAGRYWVCRFEGTTLCSRDGDPRDVVPARCIVYVDCGRRRIGGSGTHDSLPSQGGQPRTTVKFCRALGPDFPPCEDRVRLRLLLDRTSLEIFAREGLAVGSFCFVPEEPRGASLRVGGGELTPARVRVRELKSAWPR